MARGRRATATDYTAGSSDPGKRVHRRNCRTVYSELGGAGVTVKDEASSHRYSIRYANGPVEAVTVTIFISRGELREFYVGMDTRAYTHTETAGRGKWDPRGAVVWGNYWRLFTRSPDAR